MSQESEMLLAKNSLDDAVKRVSAAARACQMYRRWWKAEKEARIRRDKELAELRSKFDACSGRTVREISIPMKEGDQFIDRSGRSWVVVTEEAFKSYRTPSPPRLDPMIIDELKMARGVVSGNNLYGCAGVIDRTIKAIEKYL